jgi:hypothetical protein
MSKISYFNIIGTKEGRLNFIKAYELYVKRSR